MELTKLPEKWMVRGSYDLEYFFKSIHATSRWWSGCDSARHYTLIDKKIYAAGIRWGNDFFDKNPGEFTVTHGVPLRFMQEIYFPQTVLGCKSYTELNKKLETSEIARNEFLQNISKQPSLFSVLSPHQKNYKEAKIEAAKAWFKALKNNNTKIMFIYYLHQ